MVFCHRALLRIHFLSHLRYFERPISSSSSVRDSKARAGPPRPRTTEQIFEHEQQNSRQLLRDLNVRFPSTKPKRNVPRTAQDPFPEKIAKYMALRSHNRAKVLRMPTLKFRQLAELASDAHLPLVVDYLAIDLLEIAPRRAIDYVWTVAAVLLNARPVLLSIDRILALLDLFGSDPPSTGPKHPQNAHRNYSFVVHALLSNPQPSLEILTALAHTIAGHLENCQAPVDASSMKHRPPTMVLTSFRLVSKLMRSGENELAMRVFRELVRTRNIPPEAIGSTVVDTTAQDFRAIVTMLLTRSALHWGWREYATVCMRELILFRKNQRSIDSIRKLAFDVLRHLLDSPSPEDIQFCSRLMCELDGRGDCAIPENILRAYYDQAHQLDMPEEAALFYGYTQSESVKRARGYAPPFGDSLLWLLRYLSEKSQNRHLCRRLVEQVVARRDLIPLHDRAPFVKLAARNGLATMARTLWVKYSMERYRELVVGSPATLLEMVRLFSNLVETTQAKLDCVLVDNGNPLGNKSRGYFTLKRLAQDQGKAADEATETGCKNSMTAPPPEVYETRIKDWMAFLECIIESYRAIHEPLHMAHHWNLNALARAYFMLGHLHAGFEIFKLLLNRQEVPSLHDINVILSAMAGYNPRSASLIIRHMTTKGIMPNETTFGTVISHAILHKDLELASSLVQEANTALGGLDNRTMSFLIRVSVSRDGRAKNVMRSNLVEALLLMRSLEDGTFVRTAGMGKYCIFASLSVGDAMLAFKFWRLLVKEKAEWKDDEQAFLRGLIADGIQKSHEAQRLDSEQCARILCELGEAQRMRNEAT